MFRFLMGHSVYGGYLALDDKVAFFNPQEDFLVEGFQLLAGIGTLARSVIEEEFLQEVQFPLGEEFRGTLALDD